MKIEDLETWDGLYAVLNHLTYEKHGMASKIAREAGVDPRRLNEYLRSSTEPRYTVGMKLRRWVIGYYRLEESGVRSQE